MADFLELLGLYVTDDEATIRDRWDAWANEGLTLADPNRIDTREGSIFQITTEPGVREAARIYDRMGTEVVAASSALYAFLSYLDDQAESRGLERLAATQADGTATFTGAIATGIPTGTGVEVEPVDPDADPISFTTTAPAVVGGAGTVDVPVTAILPGSDGNVGVGAISIISTPVTGLVSVTNADPTTGGTDVETDEQLRDRVIGSFTAATPGNQLYYQQIAENWPGVGKATVIPLFAGPDTVLVVVTTASGGPVSQSTIDALQEDLDPVTFSTTLTSGVAIADTVIHVASNVNAHIAPSYIEIDDETLHYTSVTGTTAFNTSAAVAVHSSGAKVIQRQGGSGEAAIGAYVRVRTATLLTITVTANVAFTAGFSLDGFGGTASLGPVITANVQSYVEGVPPGGTIYYSKVQGAIADVDGILNVTGVLVNGAISDITVASTPPRSPSLALTLTAI